MNEQDSIRHTQVAWGAFSMFSDHHLDELLTVAGVVPCQDRSLKLQQALSRWFGGMVPNINELVRLAGELERKEEMNDIQIGCYYEYKVGKVVHAIRVDDKILGKDQGLVCHNVRTKRELFIKEKDVNKLISKINNLSEWLLHNGD